MKDCFVSPLAPPPTHTSHTLCSPLECICVGGKATLYHGKWQGTEVAVKKIEGADHRKAQVSPAIACVLVGAPCRSAGVSVLEGMSGCESYC